MENMEVKGGRGMGRKGGGCKLLWEGRVRGILEVGRKGVGVGIRRGGADSYGGRRERGGGMWGDEGT